VALPSSRCAGATAYSILFRIAETGTMASADIRAYSGSAVKGTGEQSRRPPGSLLGHTCGQVSDRRLINSAGSLPISQPYPIIGFFTINYFVLAVAAWAEICQESE
jgi:hypothetical protein